LPRHRSNTSDPDEKPLVLSLPQSSYLIRSPTTIQESTFMDNRDDSVTPADDHVTAGKLASEGVGGAAAGAAGAAIGAFAGPVGLFVGGLAGIVGGWWAGKSAAEAAHHYSNDDDERYREAYENSPARLGDRSYDSVRPAYQLGHVAGMNPEYRDRDWDAVEPDLQRGWTDDMRAQHGDWNTVRPFARDAYTRSRADAAGSAATDAVRDAGHKAANAVDDLHDRVDGNPVSRPGPDATDRPERSA
jgi:hypothetical protein